MPRNGQATIDADGQVLMMHVPAPDVLKHTLLMYYKHAMTPLNAHLHGGS